MSRILSPVVRQNPICCLTFFMTDIINIYMMIIIYIEKQATRPVKQTVILNDGETKAIKYHDLSKAF